MTEMGEFEAQHPNDDRRMVSIVSTGSAEREILDQFT